MAVAALVVGAVASVAGTVASISASNKAAKAQRKQQNLQRRRSARMAIREAQIRRAQAIATAQGAGSFNSSGVYGGIDSITSQVGERLGFSSQYSALSNIITKQTTLADTYAGIASAGKSLFNYGYDANGGLSFG